jgi:adenylosuccinate lyase
MKFWTVGLNFRELVLNDPEITAKVPRGEIDYAFDQQRQLKNVHKIFRRVFGPDENPRPTKKKPAQGRGKK